MEIKRLLDISKKQGNTDENDPKLLILEILNLIDLVTLKKNFQTESSSLFDVLEKQFSKKFACMIMVRQLLIRTQEPDNQNEFAF